MKKNRSRVPEFPQRNSFAIWNRTNNDQKKIEERRKELEEYFCLLLNDPMIRRIQIVKRFLERGSD